MDMRFFHRLGASQLLRTICSTTGGDAIVSMYGRKIGTEPEQFRHSKYIIAWGANIHGNNVHLWPFVEEARRNGAKLVVIDPVPHAHGESRRLAYSDQSGHRRGAGAGTDAHHRARWAARRATTSRATPKASTSCRSGCRSTRRSRSRSGRAFPASDIELLAHEYATTRPAAIRLNYGIQRAQNGGAAVRAVCMLPVITGSWKEVGGGLQLSLSGGFQLNTDGDGAHRLDAEESAGQGRAQHQHGGVGQGAHGSSAILR